MAERCYVKADSIPASFDNCMPTTDFPLKLFADLMREAPAQPATNLWRAVELTALIDRALPLMRESSTALDLGCGDGGVMATLRPYLSAKTRLIGVDADPSETELAEASGVYEHVLTAGAERLPLPDASVDAIVSNSVLEHIEPLESAIRECGRVMQKGGVFAATVPGPGFHSCLSGPWLSKSSREEYVRLIDQRIAIRHCWTADMWRGQLKEAGFDHIVITEYLAAPTVRRWELVSRLTSGWVYGLLHGRQTPIVIQRCMCLRGRFRLPKGMARACAWALSRGLGDETQGPYGCLLVVARKG